MRSIDDAEREHDAGDLSEADYDVLVARDRSRLAEVEAELAALGPELGPIDRPHRRHRPIDAAPPHPTSRRTEPGAVTGRGAASGSSSPACSSWPVP